MTLRRLDLAAEIYHLREPRKIPQVVSPDETRRVLAVATSLKARVLLSLSYGCGLRAGEVVRLKVKHIDSAQRITRVATGMIAGIESPLDLLSLPRKRPRRNRREHPTA